MNPSRSFGEWEVVGGGHGSPHSFGEQEVWMGAGHDPNGLSTFVWGTGGWMAGGTGPDPACSFGEWEGMGCCGSERTLTNTLCSFGNRRVVGGGHGLFRQRED